MDREDLVNRFTYHAPDAIKARKYERIRNESLDLAGIIDVYAVDCREKSLAITALEQAVMWANAAIARNP